MSVTIFCISRNNTCATMCIYNVYYFPQIWFQNRRSKFKRQSKDGHVAWMRKQLYHGGTIQSRDSSQKERCHVLTPRAPSTCTDAADKARSK